jgi:DNA ligase D-like protein (predicted polymerase)
MAWTREPTYDKPDISVRATTLYYQIVAPIMLPFLERRLLNLFRCREGKCFFQRNREHPPTGKEFDKLVQLEPVAQKNGRTEDYLYVRSAEQIIACAKVQTVEFHGWGSLARAVETPDRLVIDLDPDPALGFEAVKQAALQVRRGLETVGLDSFALLSGGKGIHIVVPIEPIAEWDEVREFAKAFCTTLAEADAAGFTVALPKRADIPRLPSEPAHSNRHPALLGPSPGGDAGRRTGRLGRASRHRQRGRLHHRRCRAAAGAGQEPQARQLGRGCAAAP